MAFRDKDIILVDFFDTLMFRHVLPADAVYQWAVCLKRKYKSLAAQSETDLVQSRKAAFAAAREKYGEPQFRQAMEFFYAAYPPLQQETQWDSFADVAGQLDKAVEYGCQYPNRALIKRIARLKGQGKTVCIVSDYYWGSETLRAYLQNANVDAGLFDRVIVSCEHGCSKRTGSLYSKVCELLGAGPDRMLMIGDNPRSDFAMAKAAGISSELERHVFRKACNRMRSKLHCDFAKRQMKCTARACYRYGRPYSEYILAFYRFTKDLHCALRKDGVSKAAFMAREGCYLKRLFERYQLLCAGAHEQITPLYLRCSRRSVFAGVDEQSRPSILDKPISIRNWLKSYDLTVADAREYVSFSDEQADEVKPLTDSAVYAALRGHSEFSKRCESLIRENHAALEQYLQPFLDNGRLYLVDSGWLGTTQRALTQHYGIWCKGYYIGTQEPADCPENVERRGILFERPASTYCDYVGMNFPFYQQLLAAPHGSAMRYFFDRDGSVAVVEKWDELEEGLYRNHIGDLQAQMSTLFEGLCAWNAAPAKKEAWLVAKTIFHSNLFAYGKRLQFIRDCEDSFLINFGQEKRGAKNYDYREVPLGPDILTKPEKYIRYVTKIQRSALYRKKAIRILYPPFARCYYAYVLVLQWLKDRF